MENVYIPVLDTRLPKKDVDAFMKQLEEWDYHYAYSDDGRVYKAGKKQEEAILAKAKQNEGLKDILDQFEIIQKTSIGPTRWAAEKKLKQLVAETTIK